jgi:hypothetical protein
MKALPMQAWICGLVLVSTPALGGQPAGPLAPITLYSEFEQGAPEAVRAGLVDELAQIMSPLGLHFDWHDLRETGEIGASVELAVITFKGRCNVAGLLPRSVSPGALGWTHISDGAILPFSDVDCNRIRLFLQQGLLAVPAAHREEAFGRALARVLAHELYHIFADTTRHGSCGVGKEAYTVRDLLSVDFRFEAKESKALKNSKAYVALEKGGEAQHPEPAWAPQRPPL